MKKLFGFFALTLAAAVNGFAGGTFDKASFNIKGEWSIVEEAGTTYIQLSEDFKTKRAPDLKVFLSPSSADQLNGRNAAEKSVFIAGPIKHKGAQRFAVPSGVNIADFETILIHCEAYSKLWGTSALTH